MRVLVLGGGVAGPAAALALAAAGHDPVVLERRSEQDSDAGSYLTIAPNGLDALAGLGVLERVRAEGFPSTDNLMVGATGRRLGTISLGPPLDDGLVALTVQRARLARQLSLAAVDQGVEVVRGARVVDLDQTATGITATLADGRRHSADVLIGADGVHSLVRRAIDPAAPAARYVGLTNFGGITRRTAIAPTLRPESWTFVFGRHSFFGAHPTPDGDVVWFVNVPEPEIPAARRTATTPPQWRQHLLEAVRDDAGPGRDLIEAGELELAGDNTYDLPHVPTWHRGRMLVIGDAAHALSPSAGQGAAMALEDAVVLGRALVGVEDPDALSSAFAAYEQARRSRVERIVKAGARSSSAKTPGRLTRPATEALLRMVFRYVVTSRSTAWMSGFRVTQEPLSVR